MPRRVESTTTVPLVARLLAYVLERHSFAQPIVTAAIEATAADWASLTTEAAIDAVRSDFAEALRREAVKARPDSHALPDPTPGVSPDERFAAAVTELADACDGALRREAIKASLTRDERREILRGMVLTRATDNRLKAFFTGSEIRYGGSAFQGKGFRSLGQEAIYAAGIRLRRGDAFRSGEGWQGDVVAPLIRDLGLALAMRPDGESVRQVLSAQMGRADSPTRGRDLHLGDMGCGVLPATAPLAIGTMTLTGVSLAFARAASGRIAVSCMGEGGSSLGEWHEAINFCAARRLPIVFCVQNNQTALSTPVPDQSAVRVFADKAAGYGIPGVTLDGTDPDEIAAAFAWAAERARAGLGPALLELVAMRICGHAHHDDMLYLGKDPMPSWTYPALHDGGYANPGLFAFWSARDPIPTYAARLLEEGLIESDTLDEMKAEAAALVEAQARRVIAAPWPDGADVGTGVLAGEPPRRRRAVLTVEARRANDREPPLPAVEPQPAFDPKGRTFLDAIMLGIRDALEKDPRVFVVGEDVGGAYGNAFLLLKPLLAAHGDRLLNAPLAESAILGAAIGAAIAGLRPIAEMQFNDFVATGFNQLVNNAAKIRYRWNAGVPMVVRMPWGGLRHAGPYHSQNTEAWFYRTPGLKIVAPSTPADARALMASAVADPDPVLYYEHIALYRDPRIKQVLEEAAPSPIPIGRAALRRAGGALGIVSYGAYVHTALRVAGKLAADGIEAAVLDLRTLLPLDVDAILTVARHCHRLLVVHEDTRTGSIGESIAAIVQEEAFEALDAPVRIVASLDTPVPYSPPLEEAFLPGDDEVEAEARLLVGY